MFGPCCTSKDEYCCGPGSYCCTEHPNRDHKHDDEENLMSDYEIIHHRPEDSGAVRRIDYDLMTKERPRLKKQLEEALLAQDPVLVAEACLSAHAVWTKCGAWPDDWSEYQRALDDVLPWNQQVSLDELVDSKVKIQRKAQHG